MLGSVLQEGETLFHLDLSYNGIAFKDCEILAERIRGNHTLFGIHMAGNEARVDDAGFIVAVEPRHGADALPVHEAVNAYVEDVPFHLRLDHGGPTFTQGP